MAYANRAPRWLTVLIGLLLTGVGYLGTFGGVLAETVGIWSCVAATLVLLAGVLFRKI
jgi:hypothetical protein